MSNHKKIIFSAIVLFAFFGFSEILVRLIFVPNPILSTNYLEPKKIFTQQG